MEVLHWINTDIMCRPSQLKFVFLQTVSTLSRSWNTNASAINMHTIRCVVNVTHDLSPHVFTHLKKISHLTHYRRIASIYWSLTQIYNNVIYRKDSFVIINLVLSTNFCKFCIILKLYQQNAYQHSICVKYCSNKCANISIIIPQVGYRGLYGQSR